MKSQTSQQESESFRVTMHGAFNGAVVSILFSCYELDDDNGQRQHCSLFPLLLLQILIEMK